MQISNRAWHLRLARATRPEREYVPHNLCHHFWAVMGSFAMILFGVYIVGLLGYGVYWLVKTFLNQFLLGLGVVALIALVGFALIMFGRWADNHPKKPKRPKIKKPPKEPGLFCSWLKARKERYCPLIEVVED